MYTFCTIITPDYINYALAVHETLLAYHTDTELFILVSQAEEGLKQRIEKKYPGTHILFSGDLCRSGVGKEIYEKYYGTHMDAFRWSMKPVLLTHILSSQGREKAIYVDCDIHFYSDYDFLFEELTENNIILTPHWRPSDPLKDPEPFILMYIFGLYNAGFVGAARGGIPALEWWARANVFMCKVDPCQGQFVDQSHLNLLHVYFDGVKALKHRGCNLAGWNLAECPRELKDGKVTIAGRWPVVFVHYCPHTIMNVRNGLDPLLIPYVDGYLEKVARYEPEIDPRHIVARQQKAAAKKQQPPRPGVRFYLGAVKRKVLKIINR